MSTADFKREFWHFFKDLHDDKRDVDKGLEFINTMVRKAGGTPPPIAEIIAIFKNEKPILYQHMKMRAKLQQHLKMIFEIDVDYNYAKNRMTF